MKLLNIITLFIGLSIIYSINAGGYQIIESTKKGSELKENIEKAIGIQTSFQIQEPSPITFLCYSIIVSTNMCQLAIRHPEEILVATYHPDSEEQFNAITKNINTLLAPYTKK